jgi:hypothetical protein
MWLREKCGKKASALTCGGEKKTYGLLGRIVGLVKS